MTFSGFLFLLVVALLIIPTIDLFHAIMDLFRGPRSGQHSPSKRR